MTDLYEDLEKFETLDGQEYRFVRLCSHGNILCWNVTNTRIDGQEAECQGITARRLSEDELKRLGIWDDLPEEMRLQILSGAVEEVHSARPTQGPKQGRRQHYDSNIPRVLKCVECEAEVNVPPSQLMKRAEKAGVSWEEFVEQFKCQRCNPTKGRGRKPNPEFEGLPEFLECKCGYKTKLNPHYLKQKAEKAGVTMQELIDGYQCQTCNPTKGRRKKS